MWVKLIETLSLDVFCQTEGISMLRNELIQKEMVDCSQTSKSKEQKHKIKIILNIAFILCYNSSWLNCMCVFSVLNLSDTILPNSWVDT